MSVGAECPISVDAMGRDANGPASGVAESAVKRNCSSAVRVVGMSMGPGGRPQRATAFHCGTGTMASTDVRPRMMRRASENEAVDGEP